MEEQEASRRLFTGGDATISPGDTVNATWPLSM